MASHMDGKEDDNQKKPRIACCLKMRIETEKEVEEQEEESHFDQMERAAVCVAGLTERQQGVYCDEHAWKDIEGDAANGEVNKEKNDEDASKAMSSKDVKRLMEVPVFAGLKFASVVISEIVVTEVILLTAVTVVINYFGLTD